jgi:hypothetical protein
MTIGLQPRPLNAVGNRFLPIPLQPSINLEQKIASQKTSVKLAIIYVNKLPHTQPDDASSCNPGKYCG